MVAGGGGFFWRWGEEADGKHKSQRAGVGWGRCLKLFMPPPLSPSWAGQSSLHLGHSEPKEEGTPGAAGDIHMDKRKIKRRAGPAEAERAFIPFFILPSRSTEGGERCSYSLGLSCRWNENGEQGEGQGSGAFKVFLPAQHRPLLSLECIPGTI